MTPDERDEDELESDVEDATEELTEEDLEPDDLLVRDRTYERFGEQGVALATYAVFGQASVQDHVADGWSRGVETFGLGAALADDSADSVQPISAPASVSGITEIAAASSSPPSDETIQREVDRRVREDDAVDASRIVVCVREGEVILAGSVPHPVQRERAMRLASSVRGVLRVTSRVHVTSRVRRGGAASGR